MTKRKNSRRADPTKAQKRAQQSMGLARTQTNHSWLSVPYAYPCSYCNSENDIFNFSPRNEKDRGRHSSRRSFCDCYIYPGAYSVYRYRSLADDMDMYGIVPCGKTYTRLLSPSRSSSCLTDFPFSRQCDKSRNIRIGNIDFFPCGF